MRFNGSDEMVSVIALVGSDEVGMVAVDQGMCLGDIRRLVAGETKAQRIAQGIDEQMNLAAKAATTAS